MSRFQASIPCYNNSSYGPDAAALSTLGVTLQEQIETAVHILKNHGVVALPTDTLYGLAAWAEDGEAVSRVFDLKGRSKSAALPLLIADAEDLPAYAAEIPEAVWPLAERFWPGPLTLVLRRSGMIPDAVTGGLDTVALRVPDHPVPREIVRRLGGPVTGTSANRSGGVETTTAEGVREEFGSLVDMVLDVGPQPTRGRASTLLDMSDGRPRILREGGVTLRQIEETCGLRAAAVRFSRSTEADERASDHR